MSARTLSRLAGLVFGLAAILGGVGAAGALVEHGTGGAISQTAATVTLLDHNWQ